MPKFNKKKGIKRVKSEAKKLPRRVAKQIPNAGMLVTGGVTGMAVKGAVKTAGKRAVKRKVKRKSVSNATRKYNNQLDSIWSDRGMKVVGRRLKRKK